MSLKFRLSGLAETFVDKVICPKCGHDGGDLGDEGFKTELTKVTFDGIVVVMQCRCCKLAFVPSNQKLGIIDYQKLRKAVEKDSQNTGQVALSGIKEVRIEVEKLNAQFSHRIH